MAMPNTRQDQSPQRTVPLIAPQTTTKTKNHLMILKNLNYQDQSSNNIERELQKRRKTKPPPKDKLQIS